MAWHGRCTRLAIRPVPQQWARNNASPFGSDRCPVFFFESTRRTDMTYMERDTYGMYRKAGRGPGPHLMGAGTLNGEDVYNSQGEKLGDIKEFMLDMNTGQVAYAVLSYGGFLGLGEK